MPSLKKLLTFVLMVVNSYGQTLNSSQSCKELIMPYCKGILLYNQTEMPNHFGHKTQEEATKHFTLFRPIIDVQCKPNLRYFLCLLYTPTCNVTGKSVQKPCASVCNEVRDACQPIIKSYNFHWPSFLDCGNFPDNGDCVEKLPDKRLETTALTSSGREGKFPVKTSAPLFLIQMKVTNI